MSFSALFYGQMDQPQTDFDEWLIYYNTEQPPQGYRNQGRRIIETLNEYLEGHSRDQTNDPEASP